MKTYADVEFGEIEGKSRKRNPGSGSVYKYYTRWPTHRSGGSSSLTSQIGSWPHSSSEEIGH